jgi:segregation and condensation protein B
MAALETLATVAYRQPITLPEIQQIRGVDATGPVKTLLDRKLITTAGRKNVIGRPILYRTTKEFLMQFGLSRVDELPSIEEFEELARAALGDAFNEAQGELLPPEPESPVPAIVPDPSDSDEKPDGA